MHVLVWLLVLVGLVACDGNPFFNQTHFRPRSRPLVGDSKREAFAGLVEYCLSDRKIWSWADILRLVQTMDPGCALLSVTQSASGTLFVIECAQAAVSASSLLNVPSEAGLTMEINGLMVATGNAGTQTSAPWHLDRIDQFSGPVYYDDSYSWLEDTGVTIYVIDTGIYDAHVEFNSGRATGIGNTIDGSGPADCHGHGTHVSSLAIGSTFGVLKNGRVRAIKALDCTGSGTFFSVASALALVQSECSAAPNTPITVSMSLSGSGSSVVDSAVTSLQQACHVCIGVAAGNAHADACNYSPARVSTCLTVGASIQNDSPASYSNFGLCLDLYAPGGDGGAGCITGAWIDNPTDTRCISGTSMATPISSASCSMQMAIRLNSGYQLGNDNLGLVAIADLKAHLSHGSFYILFNEFNASAGALLPQPPPSLPPAPANEDQGPPPPPPPQQITVGEGHSIQRSVVLGFFMLAVLLFFCS